MIVIVDYGMGNLASVKNMIHKVGGIAEISSDPIVIKNAKKIILPGVGSFDQGIIQLRKNELDKIIVELGENNIPILGICLGMQLLGYGSEEGIEAGLSIIEANFKRFDFNETITLPVPHVGWNEVISVKENNLISATEEKQRFYFTHTYHAVCQNENNILATSTYGYDFPAAYNKGNIYGVQFHPEKSHRFGMELMKNFIEI